MWIGSIIMVIVLALLGYFILFLLFMRFIQVATHRSPYEQSIEDKEQIEYLKEWRKKNNK